MLFESSPVVCRPALPKDTPDVMELTRTIWGGEDYVPHAWADWLADPAGRLAVAEQEGRVVGLSKITRLAPGEWWLEGLRVHPAYEGRGIASRLHDYQLAFWLENCEGILRLATASFRLPVQHLCERTGFEKIGEFTPFAAQPLPAGLEAFHPLEPLEAPAAAAFARSSPSLGLSYGLMDLGWEWAAPAAMHLEKAAGQGLAWWWGERGGLLAVSEEQPAGEEKSADLLLLACPLEVVETCLLEARRLAARRGWARLTWNAPNRPDLLPILQTAGFQRDWEASVYIYAKDHPNRPLEF